MTRAFHADTASNIGTFNYPGTVYPIIIDFIFFGETICPTGLAGIALIITGVILALRFRPADFPKKLMQAVLVHVRLNRPKPTHRNH